MQVHEAIEGVLATPGGAELQQQVSPHGLPVGKGFVACCCGLLTECTPPSPGAASQEEAHSVDSLRGAEQPVHAQVAVHREAPVVGLHSAPCAVPRELLWLRGVLVGSPSGLPQPQLLHLGNQLLVLLEQHLTLLGKLLRAWQLCSSTCCRLLSGRVCHCSCISLHLATPSYCGAVIRVFGVLRHFLAFTSTISVRWVAWWVCEQSPPRRSGGLLPQAESLDQSRSQCKRMLS